MKTIITAIFAFFTIASTAQEVDVYRISKNPNPTKEDIQEAITYNLDRLKYFKFKKIHIPRKYLVRENFTESHRERIVELLQGKWREDELKDRLKVSLATVFDTLNPRNGPYINAKRYAKRKNISLQKVWDSILLKLKKERKKGISNSFYVSTGTIQIAGFLKDPRFIPHLESLLKNHKGYEYRAKLALARYHLEPYHSEMIEVLRCKSDYDGLIDLELICSKAAIDEIIKCTFDNRATTISHHDDTKYFVAGGPIVTLSGLRKNRDMSKELETLERAEKKIDDDFFLSFPTKIEQVEKMRAIMRKYYDNYTMEDIECPKTLLLRSGW